MMRAQQLRRLSRTGPAALLLSLAPSAAWAQGAPTTVLPAGAVQAPAAGSTYAPTTGSYGNPQLPNGTIGGGNATESSSHPVTGEEEDSFDFRGKGGSGGAAHGDENGPVFGTGSAPPNFGGEVPQSHVVRHGDTLWGIGDYYFKNPYEWPKLWSYNPQIKNPNWIYPGDEVKLNPGGTGDSAAGEAAQPGKTPFPTRRARATSSTGGARCRATRCSCATRGGSATTRTRSGAT